MNTNKLNTDYFPALTGVRAIAAYMVFVHHYLANYKHHLGEPLFNLGLQGYIGVTLFFVLSGFLITYRYYDTPNFSFKQYMINRIARIYPIFFIVFTSGIMVLFNYLNESVNYKISLYLLGITFLKGYLGDIILLGVGQAWSLTVEETFYLLAPIMFLVIRKHKLNMILLPAFFAVFGIILVLIFKNVQGLLGFMNSYDLLFNYTFLGRACEFFVGIALALWIKSKKQESSVKKTYYTYIGIVVITLLLWWLSTLQGGTVKEFGVMYPLGKVINNVLLPVFGIAVLYYGLITEKTVVSRILGSKAFTLLGRSSYAFYLIHMQSLFSVIAYKIHKHPIMMFVILNIMAILLYKYVEEPLNLYIRKKFKPKTKA